MAQTRAPSTPVARTSQQDPVTLSQAPEERWDTSPASTTDTIVSPSKELVTSPPTLTTSGVEAEIQLDHLGSQTPTPNSAVDTFQQSSSFPATTPLYKLRADDNFTNPQELGRSSFFASSVGVTTVSGIITEKEMSPTLPPFTAYDQFKLGLIVTLSVVIGCFAITAISLRIRSRIKKRRLESEIRKRRKNRESSKPPVKRVTVKLGKDPPPSSLKGTKRPINRSHSPSLQSRAKIPEVHNRHDMDRNRTLDALLDAGTYPPVAQPPLGLTRNRARSDAASRNALLTGSKVVFDVSEHAYDNPVISSVEEMTTEVSVLSEDICPPLQTITSAEVHHGNKVARTRDPSDSDDGSLEEKSNCVESSETESMSDARKRFKLNQYFGMRSNQRNDSRDSGYVESFISQDSLRLRAMTSLEEGRASTDSPNFTGGQEKMPSRLNSIEPALFMASVDETSPNLNLNRSSSVKSENGRFVHPQVWAESGAAIRRSRYSVPSFPTQYPQCYQRTRPINTIPYPDIYSAPYMPYHANIQRYPSSESSMYDYSVTQSEHGSVRRKYSHGSRVLPKSLSYETTMYKSNDYISPYHNPPNQDYVAKKRAKRFVKRRSLGTQTSNTIGLNIQPSVQWDYDGTGNLVAKPRENMGLDFIGPIYMAEELEDMSPNNKDCIIEIERTNTSSV